MNLRFRLGEAMSSRGIIICPLGIHEPLRDVLYNMSSYSYENGSMTNNVIRDRKRSSQ